MRQQTILGKRYVLGDELGKGGIGVVHVGYDLVAQRKVAVKVLRPDHTADEESLARFEQEARIARQISHENVAKVYDFGRDGDTRYLVLELLGPTLKDLLDARRRLPARAASRIVCQVLAGLGAAHRAGIVHRDVKPQNVLFADGSDESDPLHVKLVDFGIARIASSRSHTTVGRFFGTVHYVSPEQATGQKVGPASDLYSTGILLYQLLTGALPFDGEDDLAILRRHVEEAPRPPSQLAPGIAPRLEGIVLRALEKEPGRRWPDAETMRSALASYDQAPMQATDAGQTRPLALTHDTRVWTPIPVPSGNGSSGGASRSPSPRLGATMPSTKARAAAAPARRWVGPVVFAAILLAAIVLGLVIGTAALAVTPLGAAVPAEPGSAAPARGVPAADGSTGVALSYDDFDGGCLDGTLPSRLVGGTLLLGQASGCPRAIAQFDLAERPRGAALSLSALNSPLGAPEVAVVLNDRQVFRGQLDLPDGGGWGTATLQLADGALRIGRNRLEVRNLATNGRPEAGPWMIVSGADVRWR